jgi:hypothetical protein
LKDSNMPKINIFVTYSIQLKPKVRLLDLYYTQNPR